MVKIKEKRSIGNDDLLCLFLKNGWYTKGGNEDFEAILNYVNTHAEITAEDIHKIALDIIDHSDLDYIINLFGLPKTLEFVMYKVASICTHHFKVKGETETGTKMDPKVAPQKTIEYEPDNTEKTTTIWELLTGEKADEKESDPMGMRQAHAMLDTILRDPDKR